MVFVTDQELIDLRTKELNDLLKNCTKSEAKEIKTRRRLLKNRGYAQATRSKRVETKEQLTEMKQELRQEIEQLKKDEKLLAEDLIRLHNQRERLEIELGEKSTRPSGNNNSPLESFTIKKEEDFY